MDSQRRTYSNSRIISELKSKVITEIVNSEKIVKIIDSPDKDKDDWEPLFLVNSIATKKMGFTPLLFREYKNTALIKEVCTFMTVTVQIPRTNSQNEQYVDVTLEITIYSHNDHMMIDNVLGIKDNRNDYLAILLDEMFSNSTAYDKEVKLYSSIEGVYDELFNYRKLTFKTSCLNTNYCED